MLFKKLFKNNTSYDPLTVQSISNFENLEWIDAGFPMFPYSTSGSHIIWYNNTWHLLGGSNNKTKHYELINNKWTQLESLPYGVEDGTGVVVYNNRIHLFGGCATGIYKYHYAWDGHTWTKLTDIPINFYNTSPVVYNNEIHLIGGGDAGTKHYKWDGASWILVGDTPYKFVVGTVLVYNNEIHIFGSSTSQTAAFYKYHYKWDGVQWTGLPSLNFNCNGRNGFVINDEIHFIGIKVESNSNAHYKIPSENVNTSVGIRLNDLPSTYPTRFFALNDELYYTYTYYCFKNRNLSYNIQSYLTNDIIDNTYDVSNENESIIDNTLWNNWMIQQESLPTLPEGYIRDKYAVFYNDEIHILSPTSKSKNHYKLNKDTLEWEKVSDMPVCIFGYGSCIVYNNEIYTVGDSSSGSSIKLYSWNPTDGWKSKASVSVNNYTYNYNYKLVVWDGCLHLFGGFPLGSSVNSEDHWYYNCVTNQWKKIEKGAPFGSNPLYCYNDNFIYAFCTSNTNDMYYKYDGSKWVNCQGIWSKNATISNAWVCENGSLVVCAKNGSSSSYTYSLYRFDGQNWFEIEFLDENGTIPSGLTVALYVYRDNKHHLYSSNSDYIIQ